MRKVANLFHQSLSQLFFPTTVSLIAGIFVASIACKPRRNSDAGLKVAATNTAAPTVDMNDLSYMFVKNDVGQIYPFIPVNQSWISILKSAGVMSQRGSDQAILRSQIYENVVLATENQSNFMPDSFGASYKGIQTPFKAKDTLPRYRDFEYERLVVTSFRIDPCAPSLVFDPNRTAYQGPSAYWAGNSGVSYANKAVTGINTEIKRLNLGFQLSGCQTQIRLIVQAADENFKVIGESTIHLVYTLNGADTPEYNQPSGTMHPNLTQAVLDLKMNLQDATSIDTTGLMLQEHPGLRYEAKSNKDNKRPGPGAKVILKFLQENLGRYQNSQVMAVIRETKGDVNSENGGKVPGIIDVVLGGGTSSGHYQPSSLVSSSPSRGFIMTSSEKRGNWRIAPAAEINQPINMGVFNNSGLENISDTENEILSLVMNADNPETTHFFVNDCITCHGSSQLLREMPDKVMAQNNSKRYRVPAGVAGFPIGSYLPDSAEKAKGVMLRNFGYSRNRPIIGLRTVTETAALVDYFNRDLLGLPNPGADCITPQGGQLEPLLWARTMNYGIKPTFSNAEEYNLELEKLRMSRMAPEDSLFINCNKTTALAAGKRAGNPLPRPVAAKKITRPDDDGVSANTTTTSSTCGHPLMASNGTQLGFGPDNGIGVVLRGGKPRRYTIKVQKTGYYYIETNDDRTEVPRQITIQGWRDTRLDGVYRHQGKDPGGFNARVYRYFLEGQSYNISVGIDGDSDVIETVNLRWVCTDK